MLVVISRYSVSYLYFI